MNPLQFTLPLLSAPCLRLLTLCDEPCSSFCLSFRSIDRCCYVMDHVVRSASLSAGIASVWLCDGPCRSFCLSSRSIASMLLSDGPCSSFFLSSRSIATMLLCDGPCSSFCLSFRSIDRRCYAMDHVVRSASLSAP